MTLKTEKFARKPFLVDAVQVTESNMLDVAKWCQGKVESTDAGENYIKVRVHRPLNERQTKAFVNDWILFSGTGYKVYTPKAFNQSFDRVKSVDEHGDEAIAVTRPKKKPGPRQLVTNVGKAVREAQEAAKEAKENRVITEATIHEINVVPADEALPGHEISVVKE